MGDRDLSLPVLNRDGTGRPVVSGIVTIMGVKQSVPVWFQKSAFWTGVKTPNGELHLELDGGKERYFFIPRQYIEIYTYLEDECIDCEVVWDLGIIDWLQGFGSFEEKVRDAISRHEQELEKMCRIPEP